MLTVITHRHINAHIHRTDHKCISKTSRADFENRQHLVYLEGRFLAVYVVLCEYVSVFDGKITFSPEYARTHAYPYTQTRRHSYP